MKLSIRSIGQALVVRRLATAAAIIVCCAGLSQAAEITVAGSTSGAFNGGSLGSTASYLGLSFLNSTFNASTSGGFLAIGSVPSNPNFNNFGSFSLANTTNIYDGQTFQLQVTFTVPTGISGSPSGNFSANLVGRVSGSNTGGVQINFENSTRNFSFTNPTGTGTFSLNINPVGVNPGDTVPITGYIIGSQTLNDTGVPEPATMALLGSSLIGLVVMRRRRTS